MTVYAFDIDGTICNNTFGKYEQAIPIQERIEGINYLFDKGHVIKMFTARGSTTDIDWFEFTEKQLKEWGVKYHELIMGKPYADYFIDDKGHNDFFWRWNFEMRNSEESLIDIQNHFKNIALTFSYLYQDQTILEKVQNISRKVSETIKNGGKIFFAGNGGSFADAQHLTAEFICKLNSDRNPLPAIALGTNSSSVTATGNDYGFNYVFSRELEALGSSKDFLIAISTSGSSKNIIYLLRKAKELKMPVALLTGPKKNSEACVYADFICNSPEICKETLDIQQIHIAIGHYICLVGQSDYI